MIQTLHSGWPPRLTTKETLGSTIAELPPAGPECVPGGISDTNGLPLPGVEVVAGHLRLWFGHRDDPVLELSSIPLVEILVKL